MNTWIYSRRFIDIVHIHVLIPREDDQSEALEDGTSFYEVGKLALNLLPILLSRIKALGGSQVHEVTVLLRNHPAFFCWIKLNDPLEFEKVKAARAIEDFLKVWSQLYFVIFLGLIILNLIEIKRCIHAFFISIPFPSWRVYHTSDVINYFGDHKVMKYWERIWTWTEGYLGGKQHCEHRFIDAQRLFPDHNAPLRPP